MTAGAGKLCLSLFLLAAAGPAWPEGSLKPVPQTDYIADLRRLEGLVAACQKQAQACDGGKVGDDVQVSDTPGGRGFAVHWDWLRATLDRARDPKLDERAEMLGQAQARLVAEQAEAGAAPAQSTTVEPAADARRKADAVLRGKEFHRVQDESYLEQKLALLRLWLDAVLTGAAGLVPHSAWFGLALEWGAVALAAAGLIVWAFRASRQQRVAISHTGGPNLDWAKESDDWAERAKVAAGQGDWREAVHCLYWAAIVMLEGQRLWRANRARTPREYVRLLEPGSARRQALGGLTGVFERIWYGLRPAAEQDYRQAEALLAELRTGPN